MIRTVDLGSLLDLLRNGSNVDASAVLARLRLGDRVEDMVQPLQAGSIDTTPDLNSERFGDSPSKLSSSADVNNPNIEVTVDLELVLRNVQHQKQA